MEEQIQKEKSCAGSCGSCPMRCCGIGRNSCMYRIGILVGIVLALYLGVEALKTFREYRFVGSGVTATNIITVSGEGKVSAVPDVAQFTFSTTEEGKTPAEAQTKLAEKNNTALAYVKEQGIAEADIKTLGFNVNPKYHYENVQCVRYPCPQRQVLDGFEATQTTEVKVRDTAKAGDLLAGIAEKGVQNMSDLRFTIDDETASQNEARGKAIADAKAKADALAKQLGVELVRIVNFSENGGAMPMFMRADVAGMGGAMESKAIAPEVSLGTNEITSNVSISYEVR